MTLIRHHMWDRWGWRGRTVLIVASILTVLLVVGSFAPDSDEGESQVASVDVTISPDQAAFISGAATANAIGTADAKVARAATEAARPSATPRPIPTDTPVPYDLALISASCTIEADIGFTTCEGFVRNVSGVPIEDVLVVIEWLDGGGVPRASDDALIDYNPILSGQESPWSVISDYNPALTRFRVKFTGLFGEPMLVRDDR